MRLSSTDLRGVVDCAQLLLSPFAFPNPDAWRRAVCQRIKHVVQSDSAMFCIQAPGLVYYHSDEFPFEMWTRYDVLVREIDRKFRVLRNAIDLGVWTRRAIYHPHEREVYRTAYFNEIIRPIRGFDGIGMVIPGTGSRIFGAEIQLHHQQQTGRRFGRKGFEIIRAIYPAFVSGVTAFQRLSTHWDKLPRTLDALPVGLWLGRTTHQPVHVNRALLDYLGGSTDNSLGAAIRNAAQGVSMRQGALGAMPSPVQRGVVHRGNTYEVHATVVAPGNLTPDELVLVLVVESGLPTPTSTSLARRFALTPRESQVAALLAQRKTNREIAAAVGVSGHTARHHTESVLSKLGVRSRREVLRILAKADSPS